MGKKTANSAIDFQKLFEIKERLRPVDALGETPAPPETHADAPPPAPPSEDHLVAADSSDAPASEPAAPGGEVLAFPAPASAPELAPSTPVAEEQGRGEGDTILRIGMPRALHERIRAVAALQRKPATLLVRELLEQTPAIDPKAPFAELRTLALGAAVMTSERARVDVRMQVPIGDDVHARLHQLAALRGETLGSCLIAVLAKLPAM